MWIAAVCAFEDSVVPLDRHNSLKFVNGSRGSWSCKYGFSVWLMCHSMEARAVDKSSESNQYAKEALMSREARADLSTVQVLCILSWIGGVRRPGAADKRGTPENSCDVSHTLSGSSLAFLRFIQVASPRARQVR